MSTRIEALRGEIEALRSEIAELDAAETLTDEQTARFSAALTEYDEKTSELAPLEERAAKVASILAARSATPVAAAVPAQAPAPVVERGSFEAPNVIVKNDPFDVLTDRSLFGAPLERALIDSNLRAMERHDVGADAERGFEKVLRRHKGDTRWSSNILARSRDEYSDAWTKMITGRGDTLTEAERAAIAVGTNTAGGYLVPAFLDPTLMFTNAGSSNVMRQYASIKTLTYGNTWQGVTTAGATASFDAELTEVSDDTPAVANATIPLRKPQSLIKASIEAFEDIDALTADVLAIFADARDRLEGTAHMTGSGSGANPTGLFTAINASSSLQITSTTAATIGLVDLHALYRALPVRWRGRGTFVANPLYTLAIRALGTAVSASYSTDITQATTGSLLGRPLVESDDAPTAQTTTALDQEIIFADLAEFYIVDKPGSTSIEFIPHLLNTSNNLPDGTRGWYMHWRTGSGFPNLNAGRILVDRTSA